MNLVLTFTSGTVTARWSYPGTLPGLGGFRSLGWISATIGSTDLLTVPHTHTHTHTCQTHFWFRIWGGEMQRIYWGSQFIIHIRHQDFKSHHNKTYQDMNSDFPHPGLWRFFSWNRTVHVLKSDFPCPGLLRSMSWCQDTFEPENTSDDL